MKIRKGTAYIANEAINRNDVIESLKSPFNELAATVAGLAQQAANKRKQHDTMDEECEDDFEVEDDNEPPPKRVPDDAVANETYNGIGDNGPSLMDKFAKLFKVPEKCDPAVNGKLAEVINNMIANGIDNETIVDKAK